jgi:hypothetical protein
MSKPTDRRADRLRWAKGREAELIELVLRIRAEHAANDTARDPRRDMERAKLEWAARQNTQTRQWLADYLKRVDPEPGQRADTLLGTKLGLKKRSNQPMQIYGRVSEIIPEKWGTKIRVALNSTGISPRRLKAAFAKVGRIQLRQMQNAALKAAGFVFEPTITQSGEIDLCALITDPTAAQKVASRTYTGAVVCFDGDEISDVSLVDSPTAFLEKRSAVICKIYSRGGRNLKDKDWKRAEKMSKRWGGTPARNYAALKAVRKGPIVPALPASAQRVLNEINRTDEVLKNGGGGDRLAVMAQNQRARSQYGVEYIKAVRSNPSNLLAGRRYSR